MKRQHHHPFSSFFTCIVFDRSSEEKSIESKNYACVFTFIWIPKRKKGNRTHYLLIQYFFCVLLFWIFYVNFENYFPGQLVAKCCSRQYFSNCCNGSFLLIIVLNNFLPHFANTFSRQYFWANCCHG